MPSSSTPETPARGNLPPRHARHLQDCPPGRPEAQVAAAAARRRPPSAACPPTETGGEAPSRGPGARRRGGGGRRPGARHLPGAARWARASLFAALPIDKVEPTPYQRDVSEPHVKRLVPRRWSGWTASWIRSSPCATTAVLDAQREPPPRRYPRPGGQIGGRAGAPRAGGRLPNPRPQHREGAQPEGALARSHPDVPGPGGARKGTELDVAPLLEEPAFATLGAAYEKRPRLSGGRLPLHRQAHRRLPGRAAGRGAGHPRGAGRRRSQARRRGGRRWWSD